MTDYAQLTEPFAVTHKKPGSNMTYITGEQVVSRLNEVLGWDGWSFRVLEHGYDVEVDEFWAMGELTAYRDGSMVVRQQFGSQKPNRYSRGDNQGRVIDLGFDLKGAATDALKKCASLIGVGLYLSEKEGGHAPAQAPQPAPARKTQTFMEWAAGVGYDPEFVGTVSARLFGRERAPNQLSTEDKKKLAHALEEEKKAVARA